VTTNAHSFARLAVAHAPVLVNINVRIKFEMPRFTHSKYTLSAVQFKNRSRDPDHAPFSGGLSIVILSLGLATINVSAKLEVPMAAVY